jgi:molybdate transport system ATP-binding protein
VTGAAGGPSGAERPVLSARLQVRRDAFALDVDLEVAAGEVVALLGPNGAGKTTALRALAGLAPLSRGRVVLAGRVLDEPAARRFVAPEQRRVGVVFQDYLLFPHLSARDNVAFGLQAQRVPRREARRRATGWLDRVGLAGQAAARPGALSGGQAQRVALARALATEPGLLLLDEPLAALDAATRPQVRSDLRHHLSDFSGATVLVTHDPLDAMVLADRLVVVEDGRVVQEGRPGEVARAPRTDYVARLVGLNLYRGRPLPGPGPSRVALGGGGELSSSDAPPSADRELFVAFPPSAVSLYRVRPDGSPRNAWPATVVSVEAHGHVVRVRLDGPPDVLADVTTAAVADLALRPGAEVVAVVKATEVRAYPA